MRKRIWQKFVVGALLTLLFFYRFVPWKLACAWAETLGLFGYAVSGRYRKVAERNLKLAYGDSMTEGERTALIKKVFRHFCRVLLAEFLKAPYLSPDQMRKLVKVDSYEYGQSLLDRGKGLILVTGHFGNFELLARRAALDGYEVAVVARLSPDPAFNAITGRLRENGGYTVLPRGGSPREILQRLRKGGVVAILPDQKSDDVFLPFFGQMAGTVAGPAVLAMKTGAPILPMFCPRMPDGTYKAVFKPEIDTTPTGDHDADVARIMGQINQVIEEMVREYPEQWLWLHDRWMMPRADAKRSALNALAAATGGRTGDADAGGEARVAAGAEAGE